MAIATNRSDGWPQVTMVGYVNDGYLLYCFISRETQKYANILRDPRISIAIGSDSPDPLQIKGLSLAGLASEVTNASEFAEISRLRLRRYPEYAAAPQSASAGEAIVRIAPEPPLERVALVRIAPEVISVLDYSKGFGHSDLVTFSTRDLDVHLESACRPWNGDVDPLVTKR